MMDVAIALRREDQSLERSLQSFSRYSTTPQQLVVSLEDGRYDAVGEKGEVKRRRQKEDVLDVLSPDWQMIKDVAGAAGISYKKAGPLLEDLVRDGLAEATGKGVPRNPRRFRLVEEAA